MVSFQCETCVKVLKKNQTERHYMFECRNSQHFSCLTCYKVFNREELKIHVSCITEQEKYQKGDTGAKKNTAQINVKVIVPVDMENLKWSGFTKTSKKILMGHENHKLAFNELFNKLAHVYSKNKKVGKEEVDLELVKKFTLNKIEDDDRFVIDLSKNTIRFKS